MAALWSGGVNVGARGHGAALVYMHSRVHVAYACE